MKLQACIVLVRKYGDMHEEVSRVYAKCIIPPPPKTFSCFLKSLVYVVCSDVDGCKYFPMRRSFLEIILQSYYGMSAFTWKTRLCSFDIKHYSYLIYRLYLLSIHLRS